MPTERVNPILEYPGPSLFHPTPWPACPALSAAQRKQQAGFDAAQRIGQEAIAKINANAKASASLHAAMSRKDPARVACVLREYGLGEVRAEELTVIGWTDAARLKAGQPPEPSPRWTCWVYWLEVTWDPWGGLNWRVEEGCAAFFE